MDFESIIALARDTPDSKLRAAWGTSPAATLSRKTGERPMTIKEVGALAALHGLRLEDILSI